MIEHVAIVGGGFSGSLLALNLLRHDGPRATLIERRPAAGTGVAYRTIRPELLLNVRAGNMSAFPDAPDHFVAWLARRGHPADAAGFVARATYGAYLRELIADGRARGQGRLRLIRDEVVALTPDPAGAPIRLAGAHGAAVSADAAVLAVGNLTPHVPPGLAAVAAAPRFRPDPWDPAAVAGLRDDDTVLLVGTGLTMVDVALALDADGFGGRMVALSRRGLLPHAHAAAGAPADPLRERPRGPLSALAHGVRARGAAIGWRAAVDELRPFTQAIWGGATGAERQRFLRHLRPWWDVHRHRLAPAVAARLAALVGSGRLEVAAGRIVGAHDRGDTLAIDWRPRGAADGRRLLVQRAINCTGPQGDVTRSGEPLLAGLAARGLIRPDPEHLGIDVDAASRAIGADGHADDRLLAVGPMTRGAFWEIVAVPDIRRQTWDLARRLAGAHWVGGEGL